jgi:hypothetical protein
LVTGRHESGSYYTPKPVVAFMGQEALKGYLESACPDERAEVIAAFVEERDASRLRNPERVLEALRRVKICDPACGSGAYLVGMLHELLDLRQALFAARRLDPLTAYARKLEIIQHNLYGVDLDPFAVNIARLRLWLSLIVDFEGDDPPPLPNLDFKIETGDSLTGPDPTGGLQPDMFRQQQVREYFRLKGEYMQAHGPGKLALRREIDDLRAEIAAWAHPQGGAEGFDWAVEFAEVFAENGGFDIVIGNPPYVRVQRLGSRYRALYKKLYQSATGNYDLYVIFTERGWNLLAGNGGLCFIQPNKFMQAIYGQGLRKLLASHNAVRAIVDFGAEQVFSTATNYTCILILKKSGSQQLRYIEVDDLLGSVKK